VGFEERKEKVRRKSRVGHEDSAPISEIGLLRRPASLAYLLHCDSNGRILTRARTEIEREILMTLHGKF
jgi:hypothetical protein